MATQMAGGKPRFGAIRKFADGGVVKEPPATSFRGLFNSAKNAISNALAPESPEAGQARRAREYEAMKAKYGQKPAQPAPQPSVQPNVNAGLDGMGGNSVDKRLKETGAYADGGIVKPMGAYRRGGQVKKKSSFADKGEVMQQPAVAMPSDGDGDEGAKLQGPGTATSDNIDAQVIETGEPIRVANGERILSVDQDRYLKEIAKSMGLPSVDAMLEHGTGKPVGPTIKYAPTKGARRQPENLTKKAPTFACGGKIKRFAWGGAVRGYSGGGYFDSTPDDQPSDPRFNYQPVQSTATQPKPKDDGWFPDTSAVISGAYSDVARNLKDGNYGAAAGNATRGVLGLVPAVAMDRVVRPWSGAAQQVANAVSTTLGGDENFGGAAASQKASTAAPTESAPTAVSNSYPDEQNRAPAVNAPAPAAAPAAAGALPKPEVVTTQDRIDSDKAISEAMGRKGGDAQFNSNTQKLLNGTATPNEYKQPNGGGILAKDAADMNINKLAGDETARNKVNSAWAQRGAGIQAVSDGKGGLMLTNADGPQKTVYTDTAGNPTNDYTKTQQYAEGMQNREALLKSANMTNMDGTTWSTNDNAIMAANIRDGVDPYRGTSKGREDQLMALALSPNGTPGKTNAMKMLAMYSDNQERQARGALDRSKLDIDRSKLAIEQAAEGRNAGTYAQQQARQARLEALYGAFEKASVAEREAIAEQIRVLQGRDKPDQWGAVAGEKNADGTQSAPVIYNKATGALSTGGHAPLPAGMTKQVGTSNGRPVYEDKNGKRFIG